MTNFINEDGRQGEKKTSIDAEGNKIIEIYLEPIREKYLAQRIIEKTRPVVVERETHYLDASGQVIERRVETAEPKATAVQVTSLALPAPEKPQEADQSVTRAELASLVEMLLNRS